MITVTNLSYQHSSGPVIRYPDWEVKKNDHALVLGASGSGKTTFLHLLGGLLRPATGAVTIERTEIHRLSAGKLDRFRGANFGFVFQNPHLLKSLTVKENIRLALYLGRRKQADDQIRNVLSELGIAELADRKIHEISQGQAQRVAIARAVINEPKVIFGDEPTASLDDESCAAVINLLQAEAKRHHATLVIATHDQRVKSQFQNQLTL